MKSNGSFTGNDLADKDHTENNLPAEDPAAQHQNEQKYTGQKLTEKEAYILTFLTAHRKGYGLEMVKNSGGLLKRGSVYVTLNRMQQKGYVKAGTEPTPPDEQGPPRRYYIATAKGAQALDSWNLLRSSQRGSWLTIT